MALVRDSPCPPAGWGFPPAHGPANVIYPLIAIPVELLQAFPLHLMSPEVGLILPGFVQVQETLLHLSY